jgi:hypothetical protein
MISNDLMEVEPRGLFYSNFLGCSSSNVLDFLQD